jgi:hypothetical protein
MAGKEETPKWRKKTVTWTNEMIEDLIDFIEIHPIVTFEAIYEPMLTSFWRLISFVVQLYIIMQYKGQHPPLLPKMPFCLLYLPPWVFIKISCIVYTQTWIQVSLIQVFLNGDLDAKLVSCIPGFRGLFRIVWRYHKGNQSLKIEERQTAQWPNGKRTKGQTTIYKTLYKHKNVLKQMVNPNFWQEPYSFMHICRQCITTV